MDIDYSAYKFWFDVLQLVGTGAIGVYVWWANRQKVTAKRFTELEEQVAGRISTSAHQEVEDKRTADCQDHHRRTAENEHAITRMGTEIRNMPNRQEMAVLSHDINELGSKIGRLEGRLDGLNRVADLINEFLINQGTKK